MEFLLLIPSLILGGILAYVLRDKHEDRDAFLRAINHCVEALEHGNKIHYEMISEMAERIQRPERPMPIMDKADTPPLPEPEALPVTGQILPDPEIDNGQPDG